LFAKVKEYTIPVKDKHLAANWWQVLHTEKIRNHPKNIGGKN
jgi:hypothetical protein